MAGVTQVLTLEGLADYARRVGRDMDSMDWTRAFKVAKVLIVGDIRENFNAGHAPDGTPWLPLKSRDGLPLRDKGLLLAASTARVQETTTQYEMVLSNVLDYAAVHQYGADVPAKERAKPWVFQGRDGATIFTRRIKAHSIPARPFMGVSGKAVKQIGQVFAEHVTGKL